ncbi:MAG: hypothetical protein M0Z52_02350 [Actinomycetota bacterium]|nr:hypothetical protein [Nitrospiraceae bacterium]MDA8155280.1 hypothetical protein [Actinomycetota bacterium]
MDTGESVTLGIEALNTYFSNLGAKYLEVEETSEGVKLLYRGTALPGDLMFAIVNYQEWKNKGCSSEEAAARVGSGLIMAVTAEVDLTIASDKLPIGALGAAINTGVG